MTRRSLVATLGTAMLVPLATVAQADPRARITFSGLQRSAGGQATLFVHLSQKTPIEVTNSGRSVMVRFSDADIGVRNNSYPLDLSHFNLLIVSSRLVAVGNDVDLHIELRQPAKLEPTWVQRDNGQVSLHVHIPAQP